MAGERIFRFNGTVLEELPAQDPARLYKYRAHPDIPSELIYLELTPAQEAARLREANAPPFNAEDWYWLVAARPGEVYHSARFAYVPLADPAYQTFLLTADPREAQTEAELRQRLNNQDVAYLAETLPPIEERRPRVQRARLRLVVNAQSLVSGTAAALQWSGTGDIDPLNMHNPGAQPAQITIPLGQGGVYLYSIAASIAASATGTRALQLRRGLPAGTAVRGSTVRQPAPATGDWEFFGSRPIVVQGGDVLRVFALQDSGGPLAIDAEIALLRLE